MDTSDPLGSDPSKGSTGSVSTKLFAGAVLAAAATGQLGAPVASAAATTAPILVRPPVLMPPYRWWPLPLPGPYYPLATTNLVIHCPIYV